MTDERSRIFAEQVRQLYDNALIGMVATLVNASALTVVLWKQVSRNTLVSWFALLVLLTILRYFHVVRRLKNPAFSLEPGRRALEFIAGIGASGVMWGAAGVLLPPSGSLMHQVFIAFVLGGMVAGAAGVFSIIREAFLAFSIPALAPLILRFFLFGDELHVAMGGMTLLFAGLIHVMAFRVHQALLLSLTLRFENSSLVSHLGSEKERTEKLNKELKFEIVERIAAQEELQRNRDHLESLVKERTEQWAQSNTLLQAEIAARTIAEQLRRQSEASFRSLVDNTLDLITVLDSSGNILFESPSVERLLGCRPEDMIGRHFFEFVHPEDRPAAQGMFNKLVLEPGSSGKVELRVRHIGGSWLQCESIGKSMLDDSHTVRVMIDSRDITERKKHEVDRLKAEKLDSLGILAGGIAHDYNNIMSGITINIELARMQVRSNDPLEALLEKAEHASVKALGLTQQLLTFARGGEPVKKTLQLNGLIREAAGQALSESRATLALSLPDELRPVEADAGQVRQVIHNIVINADEAMPRGGVIRINAENAQLHAQEIPALKAGEYVKITISDQGVGIPGEHLSKIYDPYFTTKQLGSGLGLAAAYSIMKKHGGGLVVASEPGVGTAFSLYLPVSAHQGGERVSPVNGLVMGKGRILIMDDDEVIRDTAGKTLEMSGYDVEFARDGREAIALYSAARANGKPFDVVIMDLTIPGGIGGKDAVKELHKIDPRVKAIVSSGYSHDPIMAQYREHGFIGVIAKPFRVREMSELVSRVMAMER